MNETIDQPRNFKENIFSKLKESRAAKLLKIKQVSIYYSSFALAKDPVSAETAQVYQNSSLFVEQVRRDAGFLAQLAFHDQSELVRKNALGKLLDLASPQTTRTNIAISLERSGVWADNNSGEEIRNRLKAGMVDLSEPQIFAQEAGGNYVPTFHAGLIIQAGALEILLYQCQQGLGIAKQGKEKILAFLEKSGLDKGYQLKDLYLSVSQQAKPKVIRAVQAMGIAEPEYRRGDPTLSPSIDQTLAAISQHGKTKKIEPVEVGDLPGFKQVVALAAEIKAALIPKDPKLL